MNQTNGNSLNGEITIDRHVIDSISIYEVTEDQLTNIQAGSEFGTSLNFAISSWSIFLSFVVSLLTTRIVGVEKLVFFWVISSVSLVSALFFTISWLRGRDKANHIFTRIRSQKSSEALRDSASASTPVVDIAEEQYDGPVS